MKNRAYIVILAALVALMAASGASAQRAASHANYRQAVHSSKLMKQLPGYHALRRSHRNF